MMIKTGKEIENQFNKDARYIVKNRIHLEELAKQKWVSVDWLKEQIKEKRCFVNGISKETLDWVLDLLKEGKND